MGAGVATRGNFGSGYGAGYGGGAMKGPGYSQRAAGPYGGSTSISCEQLSVSEDMEFQCRLCVDRNWIKWLHYKHRFELEFK
jgi:hypothetical protein